MEYEDKDLVGKNEDDIYRAYADIANDIEIQKIIWNETKNLDVAVQMYNKYLEKKKVKTNINNKG